MISRLVEFLHHLLVDLTHRRESALVVSLREHFGKLHQKRFIRAARRHCQIVYLALLIEYLTDAIEDLRQSTVEALSYLTQSAVHCGLDENERDKLLLALLSIACTQKTLDRVKESFIHEINLSTSLGSIDKACNIAEARVYIELRRDTLILLYAAQNGK